MRPRRPEDPLFQEYSARKARHEARRAEAQKTEAYQLFLAEQRARDAHKPHSMASERAALKASRAYWQQVKQELQREAESVPVKRTITQGRPLTSRWAAATPSAAFFVRQKITSARAM